MMADETSTIKKMALIALIGEISKPKNSKGLKLDG